MEPPVPGDGGEEEAAPGERAVRGFGFHDVVIETPRHDVRLWDLDTDGVRDVLLAYAARVRQLAEHPAVKYVQMFKNHGVSAGASMAHSHSQMLGTPFVPASVTTRLNYMKFLREWDTAVFARLNPKTLDLGSLLKTMLQKLCKQLNDPPFNFMIHSAPFGLSSSCLPYAHWFLQIVPQLNVVGGFEIGSGCYINPVFPEEAAKILRELDSST